MLGSLLRGVLWLVLIVAVVVGVGSYFLGYRSAGGGAAESETVGTSGSSTADTGRERGAEIGEQVGRVADRAGEALSDGTITAKVKSKMALDDIVEAREIDVTTRDRVVTLSGTVASAAERERALQLARETEGVESVSDKLKVVK